MNEETEIDNRAALIVEEINAHPGADQIAGAIGAAKDIPLRHQRHLARSASGSRSNCAWLS